MAAPAGPGFASHARAAASKKMIPHRPAVRISLPPERIDVVLGQVCALMIFPFYNKTMAVWRLLLSRRLSFLLR